VTTFVGVCEGFLGIPVNWDLWVHLFRAELHTLMMPEPKIRRAVRASGMTIALRNTRREFYIPCTMTSNNAEWERGWFCLRNNGAGLPPYSGKVLKDKADSWHHGVSPPSHQTRLDSLLAALKALADGGLTAGCVLANLHHRRIVPLMERPLRIYKMHEDTDPIALAEATYAVVALRKLMEKRGPEIERSPARAAVISPEGTSCCEATRVVCRRSVRACREHWPERQRCRGAEGPAASALAGVDIAATRAAATGTDPAWRRARSSSRLVRRMR
jgi:hypothetical protein